MTSDDPPPYTLDKQSAAALDDRGAIKINLRACALPVENTSNVGVVYVTVQSPGQGTASTYNATRTGKPGEYVAHLPVINQGPGTAATAVCNGIAGIAGFGCDILSILAPGTTDEALCAFLAVSADIAAFGPTGESAPLFTGCEGFVKGMRLYCGTIGDAPGPPGPESPIDMGLEATGFCDEVGQFLDRASPTSDAQYVIQAVATGAGKFKATSSSQTVNANGPFAALTIDFGGEFSVDSFTITPSNPGPGQGYTVNVRFSCIAGQKAIISVEGDDGYSDSASKNLTGASATLSLSVPGAAAGVHDRVKVQIELAPGDVRTFRDTVVEF
jgi:hypothetical protein